MEEEDDEIELDWLFSSQEEETEAQELFKCIHDRDEFTELGEFKAHNKAVHRRWKRKCKVCHNVFRETKQLKTHMKKLHDDDELACIHDGRCFARVNGLHMHNSDCHKKYKQVCPHSKCLNVFNGKQSLQIHMNQQHPKPHSCHRKTPRQWH
ncbi:hypothetical protein M5689_024964 [Euphorbia peplus]|nr:hypothetical protein M5689_024964 [Euphorbia peplus]